MKTRPHDTPRDSASLARSGGSSRAARAWRMLVAAVAVGAVGIAGWAGWNWLRFPERVKSALPAMPDVANRPAILRQAMKAAQTKTMHRSQAIEGVADLARLYHANGFFPEAEQCWGFLHREQPREARWVYHLADVRKSLNDYSGYKRWLEQTLVLAPDYTPARLQLAALEFKSGAFDGADAHYRRALALAPGDPHARLGAARIALQQGDRVAAKQQLEQLVRATPEFPPGHNLYAEVLAGEGQQELARRHRWLGREAGRFREPEDPWHVELIAWCHDPDRLGVLGTMEFQAQRNDRARELLAKASALAPNDLVIRTLLAELYLKTGDAARARDTLQPALTEAGNTKARLPLGLYVTLSEAYRVLARPSDALQVLQAGLDAHAEAGELQQQRGLILAATGRGEEARTAFRAAAGRMPNSAEPAFQLALSLLSAGERTEALGWLQRAVAAQPNHPLSLALLARFEMEGGRLDAAWGYLEPLYEANSGEVPVRQLVAKWHRQAGEAVTAQDRVRAERYFVAGLEVWPDDPELQASLGVLQLVDGRVQEALPKLEAYHRLEPENARSSLFLGQAYASLGRIDDARRALTRGEQLALRAGQTSTAQHCREMLRQL